MNKLKQDTQKKTTEKLQTSKKKPQQIFDTTDTDNVGVVLWSEDTLQAITKQSGANAKGNEYQVHYWALNVRITTRDNSRLDVSIPTVIFNYKQEVSPAHIDFELNDVDEVSNALEIIHNIEVNKLLAVVKDQFSEAIAVTTVEYMSTNLNSLHKHPGGRRQSFSGTDLNKAADVETGIVFPLSEGNKKPNFASIICEQNGKTYLAHTEYRVADGKINKENGKVTYTKGRCVSYVAAPVHKASDIESLFGYKDTLQAYSVTDDLDIESSDLFSTIINWWDSLEYKSNVDFIKPENVTKELRTHKTSSYQQVLNFEEEEEELSPQMLTQVIEFAQKKYELVLPTLEELTQLDQTGIDTLYNNLECYYYTIDDNDDDDDDEEEEFATEVPLKTLLELYDLVLMEIAENILDSKEETLSPLDEKRKDLIDLGAHPDHIRNAPAYLIEQWCREIIGE